MTSWGTIASWIALVILFQLPSNSHFKQLKWIAAAILKTLFSTSAQSGANHIYCHSPLIIGSLVTVCGVLNLNLLLYTTILSWKTSPHFVIICSCLSSGHLLNVCFHLCGLLRVPLQPLHHVLLLYEGDMAAHIPAGLLAGTNFKDTAVHYVLQNAPAQQFEENDNYLEQSTNTTNRIQVIEYHID